MRQWKPCTKHFPSVRLEGEGLKDDSHVSRSPPQHFSAYLASFMTTEWGQNTYVNQLVQIISYRPSIYYSNFLSFYSICTPKSWHAIIKEPPSMHVKFYGIWILLFSECQSADSLPEGTNELGILHDIMYCTINYMSIYQSHSNQSKAVQVQLNFESVSAIMLATTKINFHLSLIYLKMTLQWKWKCMRPIFKY